MAAQFPDSAYSTNTQDISNDGPANDELGQAADYNKHDEEIDALTQEGRKSYLRAFRNDTGATLNAGDLVHIIGFDVGIGLPTVTKSKADAFATLAEYVVIANVANNANGNIANRYLIASLDTSTFVAGDEVYLDATTSGTFTKTAPNGANFAQYIGKITKVNATTGEVEFNISRPVVPDKVGLEYGTAEILQLKASGVTAAKLADAIADIIPTIADITKDSEGDTAPNVIRFTIQIQDAQGNNVSGRRIVFVWVATADFNEPEGTQIVAVNKGIRIAPFATNQSFRLLTETDGEIFFDVEVTGAGTRFIHAAMMNSPAKSLSGTWT